MDVTALFQASTFWYSWTADQYGLVGGFSIIPDSLGENLNYFLIIVNIFFLHSNHSEIQVYNQNLFTSAIKYIIAFDRPHY
jgi:hypothetical protein